MGLSSKEVSIDGPDWTRNSLKYKRPRQLQQQQQQQQQQQSPQLKCPRCNSTNTKFCYYNNYNRSQPRHFCKSCKRHWTKGGTQRNVPIGGRRNNKRLKTTKYASSSSSSTGVGVGVGVGDHISFVQERQQHPLAFEDQKNNHISEILYQALFQSPSLQPDYINSFSGSSLPLAYLPNLPFTSSSFFNNNPSLMMSSSFIDSSNVCDYTNTTTNTNTAAATNPMWKIPNATSLMDLDGNWSWNELNTLISSDLKQPCDDFQIKEQGI